MERYQLIIQKIIERSRDHEEGMLTNSKQASIDIVKLLKQEGFKQTSNTHPEVTNKEPNY